MVYFILFQETLKELFPSWDVVSHRYREVVLFVAGQMKDSRPLVQFIYEMQVESYLDEIRASSYPYIDSDLLKALHTESSVRLFDHPLHNKYINYYDHSLVGDSDTTPVYFPSGLYHFWGMRHLVVLEDHLIQGEEIPPCTMYIYRPDKAVSDTLLSICSEVSRLQALTDLIIFGVNCGDATETPILSRNIQSLDVLSCHLSRTFMRNILQQLHDCVTLTNLDLRSVGLSEVEKDLDQLLDNLVSNHEKGLSQEKLMIRIMINIFSEEFVAKWNKRCEGITSIECDIR